MSQVTHPSIPVSEQVRAHRAAVIGTLLALCATIAVVLVLALDDTGISAAPVAPGAQQSLRPDGGPEESGVAASIGSRSSATGPDESRTAAAISGR
jgi:hypothetical protein